MLISGLVSKMYLYVGTLYHVMITPPFSSFLQSFLNYGHSSAIFLVVAYVIAIILIGAAFQTAGIKPLSLHKLFVFKRSTS